jgi:hypothetical protein
VTTPPTSALARTKEPLPGFTLVLVAFFAELMLAPWLESLPGGLLIVRSITVVLLLVSLSTAGVGRPALLLLALVLAGDLVASRSGSVALFVAATALHALFIGFVLVFILKRVARARVVSFDTIAGAACAYLLIAVLWADLYVLLETWRPGSIAIAPDWSVGTNHDLRAALTYFSFVMITTVGHVFDVASPGVGTLCVAETLLAQLYLAVLIARIVGLSASGAAGAAGAAGPKSESGSSP